MREHWSDCSNRRGDGPLALVTGATGALAPAVVTALMRDGWRVRTLARREAAGLQVEECLIGDFTLPDVARRATRDVSAVFHLAAKLHVPNPEPRLAGEYERVNVHGARILAAAAEESGVGRFVHFSTISVYGPFRGVPFVEDDDPNPEGMYAESKRRSELAVFEELTGSETQPIVLRLAAVYGPNLKGNYLQLVKSICRGRFIAIGDGRNRRTLIHETEVARAALLAATRPVRASVMNVTDGRSYEVREILAAITEALGRKPWRFRAPVPLVRGALRAVEVPFRLVGRKPPVGEWLLDKYLEDVVASGGRIQEMLGFQPSVDLLGGWRDTVEGLRKRGEIPPH